MNRFSLSLVRSESNCQAVTCQQEGDDSPGAGFDDDFDLAAELAEERRIDYLPSPVEIVGACRQIRAQWSHSEHRRRFVGDLPCGQLDDLTWQPPLIDTSLLRLLAANAGEG